MNLNVTYYIVLELIAAVDYLLHIGDKTKLPKFQCLINFDKLILI